MHVGTIGTSLPALVCAVLAALSAAQAREPSRADKRAEVPCTVRPARAVNEAEAGAFHPGRLLVRFKSTSKRAGIQAVHQLAGAKSVVKEFRVVDDLQLVEVPEDNLAGALAVYQGHPDVLYAEPDYRIYLDDMPNDPEFYQLWGLRNTGQTVNGDPGTAGADIRALEAWHYWTGDPEFRIAVIDTGIDYTHPDLAANIWTNPGEIPDNGIDDDGNGWVDDVHGYNFADDTPDPNDWYGHGTHVSGTIGAVADNGVGVAGVNWECKIVALNISGNP